MRNLLIGLVVGVTLGIAASRVGAQRGIDLYPDAVTADPKHYSVSFENDVVRFVLSAVVQHTRISLPAATAIDDCQLRAVRP